MPINRPKAERIAGGEQIEIPPVFKTFIATISMDLAIKAIEPTASTIAPAQSYSASISQPHDCEQFNGHYAVASERQDSQERKNARKWLGSCDYCREKTKALNSSIKLPEKQDYEEYESFD